MSDRSALNSVFEVVGLFATTATVALAGSYGVYSTLRKRRSALPLELSTARLRGVSSVYRSKFLRITPEGWVFSAPLQRDHYVPLRVGESLKIECPTDKGVLLFRSIVISRDHDTHELLVQKPSDLTPIERRIGRRFWFDDLSAMLEGSKASVVNLNETGACVISSKRYSNGERVSLTLPDGTEVMGAVLETQMVDSKGKFSTRIVFENQIVLSQEIRRRASLK